IRRGEPRRALDVAHERRDPRVRLGIADQRHPRAVLLHRLEVDPVRQLANELVEQVHRFGPVRLQRFDDLLSRQQRLRLVAQPVNFLDLLVELRDLSGQELITPVLIIDLRGDQDVPESDRSDAQDGQPDRKRDELSLARLALLLPAGKEVDANHQSKLRMARPQAISRRGASEASWRGRIRSDTPIFANGLPTIVLAPARLATSSSRPGTSAQPPDSTI